MIWLDRKRSNPITRLNVIMYVVSLLDAIITIVSHMHLKFSGFFNLLQSRNLD
jgi:hypothetical protein